MSVIEDVQRVTEDGIIGKDASVKGIDSTQAAFCIVDDTNLKVGDVLSEVVDVRSRLTPSLESRLKATEDMLLTMMLGGM